MTLRDGLETRRYWRSLLDVRAAHALPIDEAQATAGMAVRDDAAAILEALKRDGVAVIENYWPVDRCEAARREVDRLIVRYPDCVQLCSGGSDKRLFGVEMASDLLRAFHDDAFPRSTGEVLGRKRLYNLATLGARIDWCDSNNGSGDGWHRDAFGFQFKSIIYLSDVAAENGPFEYVIGSHTLWRAVKDAALGRAPAPPQSRLEDDAVEALIARGAFESRRYTAQAGTLILANSAGLHRGMPLRAGTRYALTNYYYSHYQVGRSMLDKFSPLLPGAAERLMPLIDAGEADKAH